MLITYRFKAMFFSLCAIAFSAIVPFSASAEDGVYDDRIVFGQVGDFEGTAANLGNNMRLGILTAFDESNRSGGVQGKKLELVALNDNYDAVQSVVLANQLIEKEKVFALIGMIGTASAMATLPIAIEKQIPFIGPYTGAAFMHDESKNVILNIRASYHQEVAVIVDYIVEKLKLNKIGVLYQNDAFGYDGLKGVQKSLEKYQLKLVSSGAYTRGKFDINNALKAIDKGNPQVVILVSTYRQSAKFIRESRALGSKAIYFCIAAVGSKEFIDDVGEDATGIYITQIVPSPKDETDPLVKRYREALKITSVTSLPDFGSLEGYVVGRAALAILERTPTPITRAGFLETAHNTDFFDIDGYKLTYKGTTFASDQVFMFKIKEGGSLEFVQKAKAVLP